MSTVSTSKEPARYWPAVAFVALLLVAAEMLRFFVPSFVDVAQSVPVIFALMVAGTLIAVLRNEVGVSTFGVFGPVIFAYAWLALGPLWGAAMVLYVFVVAMLTRFSLEPLDMGTPHRMAIVLISVGFASLGLAAVGRLNLVSAFGTALLFPVILSSWYGDRFVGQVAETGWAPATRRLAWTVVAVTLAYAVISFQPFMDWFIVTPEAWVALVAVNLVLGYATDIRVGELLRFGTLRRSLGGSERSAAEILTMRVRNRDFIGKYNPGYLLATMDKIQVKSLLHSLEVPTPETYLCIESEAQLAELEALLEERSDLVVKPADGLGGEGVLVVAGREGDRLVTSKGDMSVAQVIKHARSVLQGRYASGYDTSGKVIVERRVEPDDILRDLAGSGVPDVRVIVFQGFPLMAMARLPTRASKGTANLHGGAVGVAIDLADGTPRGAYQQSTNRWLDAHPDTGAPLDDFVVPEWDRVLEMASKAASATHLGYAGVDIVFDAEDGPMVLEVNRRPGLGIQNVNMAGLLKRLTFVKTEQPSPMLASARAKVERALEWHRLGWDSTPDTPADATEVAHEA